MLTLSLRWPFTRMRRRGTKQFERRRAHFVPMLRISAKILLDDGHPMNIRRWVTILLAARKLIFVSFDNVTICFYLAVPFHSQDDNIAIYFYQILKFSIDFNNRSTIIEIETEKKPCAIENSLVD